MRLKRSLYLLVTTPLLSLTLFLLYVTLLQSKRSDSDSRSNCDYQIGLSIGSKGKSLTQTSDGCTQNIVDWVDKNTLEVSEHPDIDVRGMWQKKRIKNMCKKHYLTKEQSFPNREKEIVEFHSHLIFDDERRAIFCFVPKVGCTNMKRLMFYMSGNLPLYTIDWPWVEYTRYLLPAMKHASFLNKTLTEVDKRKRMKSYYKFMMVRNPFERLVSAYRDKLQEPLLFGFEDTFPEMVKVDILNRFRPEQLSYWKHTFPTRPFDISVTFSEFCRYITETDSGNLNEHFVPSMDLCHPCLMEYDFYGEFRNYSTDVSQLVKKFNADPRFYRDKSLHSLQNQTSKKVLQYYQMLTHREKTKLLGAIYDEVMFYYTLYPTQRHSHVELLGIDLPVETVHVNIR